MDNLFTLVMNTYIVNKINLMIYLIIKTKQKLNNIYLILNALN